MPSEIGQQSYSVAFEEYGFPRSQEKALIFESLRELGVFLKREVGASDGTFERVIADLRDREGAEICDVVFSREELDRLGFP
jgi:hypothetical protein